jgi:outer membrane autotransporter protein
MMTSQQWKIGAAALTLLITLPAQAEDAGWYARAHGGLSSLSDSDGQFEEGNDSTAINADADSGAFTGIAGGYRFGNGWRTELAWEYRNNDLTGSIGDTSYPTADFASSTVYVNGIYAFDNGKAWTPYIGAGLAWAQEIDIDFERDGMEQSYSTSGDAGFQVFAGVEYALSNNWTLSAEARYSSIGSLDLDPESNAPGQMRDLDYQHTSLQIGMTYNF